VFGIAIRKAYQTRICWASRWRCGRESVEKWKGKQKETAAKTEKKVKDDEMRMQCGWLVRKRMCMRGWLNLMMVIWKVGEQDSAERAGEDNLFSHGGH